MTNYEKIKEACVKANPKLMELSFGCRITLKQSYTGEEIEAKIIRHIKDNLYQLDLGHEYITDNDQILGHEPTLADVLLAIGETHRGLAVNVDGEMKGEHLGTKFGKWDLTKPLKDQSEECLNFLADLL